MTATTSSRALIVTTAAAASIPVGLLLHRILFRKKTDPKEQLPYTYPPGPKQHFLFGNLLDPPPDFQKGESYDTNNLKASVQHGLIFCVNIPFLLGRIIFIADPVLAKYVLVTKNFPKPLLFYAPLKPLIGPQSLVTLVGKEWQGMRKSFNPGFAPLFLQTMASTMAQKLERLIARIDKDIQKGGPTHMLQEAQAFTSDVIVQIAFGEDWGGDNHDEPHLARQLEDEICALYSRLQRNVWRRIFDFPTKRRMHQVGIELDLEMRAILERRLQQASVGAPEKARDILSLAISHITKDKQGEPFLTEDDKAYIVDQLKTFYFAGHDTTATTIAWATWELSQHPEALARLRVELQQHGIWSLNNNDVPSYEQLKSCPYLEAVITESLRLFGAFAKMRGRIRKFQWHAYWWGLSYRE